jgi:hypothetical protein
LGGVSSHTSFEMVADCLTLRLDFGMTYGMGIRPSRRPF